MALLQTASARRRASLAVAALLGLGTAMFLLRPDGPLGHRIWAAEAIEPHVAATGSQLALAWMEVAGAGEVAFAIAVRRSQDGGTTFGPVEHLAAPGGRLSADPTLAYGRDGSLYVSWLAFRSHSSIESEPYDMAVLVAKARPGVAAFEPPVLVADDRQTTYDKPWSTVSSDGTLHVVYRFAWANRAGFHDAQVMADGSRKTVVLVDGAGFSGALPVVCSDPARPRIFVANLRPELGIELYRIDLPISTPSESQIVSLLDERIAHQSPSCVVEGGAVYLSYGLSDGMWDSARSPLLRRIIVVKRSEPSGELSRQSLELPEHLLMHPQLVAPQSGSGVVQLAYLMGRRENDPDAVLRLWTLHQSPDSAQTLRRGLQLVAHREDRRWPGDYLGTAVSASRTVIAFIDNRRRRHAEIVFAGP